MKLFRCLATLIVAVLLAGSAPGIVVINPDESECLAPPPDGAPWNYVARLDNKSGARASGVYLGNRYILTANHVDADISNVHLNGTNYAKDEGFKPVPIEGTDLRVMRIATDPGLPPIPIIGVSESEFSKPCIMIGYGVGKGTPVANQGWNWAGDSSRKKRWATNTTAAKYHVDPQSHITYIQTSFDFTAGPQTGEIAVGDSGCGLFVKLGGVWKLVGIGGLVDGDNQALYNANPSAPEMQPNHSFFVALHRYVIQLKKIREN